MEAGKLRVELGQLLIHLQLVCEVLEHIRTIDAWE